MPTTAIDILKQVPQGIPTQLMTTGAAESASIAISAFGQTSGIKLDMKMTDSSATIPSSATTASNFSKTAHPGGAVDLTSTYLYVEETLNSVATRHIIYPGATNTYRNRNASETFDAAATLPAIPGHARDADVARSLVLGSYFGNGLALYSGAPSRLTALGSLTLLGTNNNFTSYNSNGSYVASNTGFAISIGPNGYTQHATNFSSGTVYAAANSGADLYYYVFNNYSGGTNIPYNCRLIGYGNYIFVFSGYDASSQYVFAWAAPISGFAATNSTLPGWAYKASLVDSAISGTGSNNIAASSISELGGTALFLMPSTTGTAANQVLCKAVMNGTTGAVTGLAKVVAGVDGTFAPIKIAGKLLYRYTAGTYFFVDSSGTVTTPSLVLSRSLNMKTLATNYATAGIYKNVDGASDTDGLAYYTNGSAPYTTTGSFFCTKDGKYTLVDDTTLNSLTLFDTDNSWMEKQLAMSVGDRVDYTQVTLGPSTALWVTANGNLQVNIFGFKAS